MAIDFPTVVFLNSIIGVGTMAYYYYWGVSAPLQKKVNISEVMKHVKNAYALTVFATIFMPMIMLYYLYDSLLYQFPDIFMQTSFVVIVVILIFEYVNYYSYLHYERHRLRKL